MLTVNTTNYNFPEYKPAFRGTEGKYKPVEKGLEALFEKVILEEQERVQTKVPKSNSGSKLIQFFRKLFFGSSANKQETRHFKNKYGRFSLTDKGVTQYAKIMPELFDAEAMVKSLCAERYKTDSDKASIAKNLAIAGICLVKLDLLKYLGEIDTTQGRQHYFKSQYGKFNLSDKGLEQYLEIVPELEKAKAMVKTWCSEGARYFRTTDLVAKNRGIAGICLAKLDLLKSMGEIDTQSGKEHRFKSRYGKFNLTDKGLEQYLKIIPEMETARGMVEAWNSYRYKDTGDRVVIAKNNAAAAKCRNRLELLKNTGELPDDI